MHFCRSLARRGSRVPATPDEGHVALQTWLFGELRARAPHAAHVFASDPECLYDAFLSVLVAGGMGFADHDDNRFHHGLYAFDFRVGDLAVPSAHAAVSAPSGEGAFCHAIVDAWMGVEGKRRIPFVASINAALQAVALVADASVDECVFQFDLPPKYASSTANRPWEDGSLPIGALDSSLVVPGPLIHIRACAPHDRKGLTDSGFAEALAASTQMGMRVESAGSDVDGAHAVVRGPHGCPEAFGWAADAVARALSARGYSGGLRIRAWRGERAA